MLGSTRISSAFVTTISARALIRNRLVRVRYLVSFASLTKPTTTASISSSSSTANRFQFRVTTIQRRKGCCRYLSSIADTPLGNDGADLLDGLDVYTVPAMGDHHPLSVYGIDSQSPTASQQQQSGAHGRFPILLLHGRTWSSVPVYHLLGGNQHRTSEHHQRPEESRSLMEALLQSGLQPYAMDFRGFGGTPKDATGCVEPLRCVEDVESVLIWIAQRHGVHIAAATPTSVGADSSHTHDAPNDMLPTLLGWSQGALVAQMVAQKSPLLLSKLVLYGSIYDPLVRYARAPLYVGSNKPNHNATNASAAVPVIFNQFDDAIEDFTIEGTIPPEPAKKFAEAALISDPIKAVWKHLYQFNNCDPARVHVPTLVVAGDQDPYAPLHVQQELFRNLGRGSDRTWSILADADHAVHLLEGRARFTKIVTSFVQNSKRSERKSF